MKPPARKLVQCTNEECPEVATAGQPWKGQRKSHRATEEPCPRCSSAVAVVVVPMPTAESLPLAATNPLEELAEEPMVIPPRPPLREPYTGRPTVTCREPVVYGLAAHQRIEALARSREHRGKTRPQLIGWVLDQWGAGLP